MTAIVGILNKNAAVMAADSAMTVKNKDAVRIYNNTTKIFKLSDKHPVAAMIYNNLDFVGVPINILINRYREKEGDKSFDTLQGYVDNFVRYVSKEKKLKDEIPQKGSLYNEISTYCEKLISYVADAIADTADEEMSEEEVHKQLQTEFRNGIEEIDNSAKEIGELDEFKNYSFERFLKYADDVFEAVFESDDRIPEFMFEEIKKGVYNYLRSSFFYNGTGIIFVGYGDDEIFPSLIPIYLSSMFDGHFRYCYSPQDNEHISNENRSAIVPFAQTDVMMTVMKGISPVLYNETLAITNKAINQTKNSIVEELEKSGVSKDIIEKIQQLQTDNTMDKCVEEIDDYIQQECVEGLINTVESFGIEDMANMAASLIEITNLQRHITSSEESVGGPVDVAVLTLDRGFVWFKHHDWTDKAIEES